jgi:KaiC/GvpD/RAD55 family RecA-like ATPase
MTSAGGFYSPQLIIFLGGPKTFKTGLLINLATEYALDGLNVFYADFENGADELLVRFQQCLCECTEDDLEKEEFRKMYKSRKKAIKTAGGGIYLRSFYARVDSMKSVEKEIDLLIKAEEFIPDVIFIDYLDIVGTSDPYVHERRLIIQDNYLRAVSLNKKYDCFTFSISRVKQSGFDKTKLGVGDMGEDSEKVYNAHAVFSYVRDENDRRANMARISSLVQRKGESYGRDDCWVEIDESRQSMWEVEPGLV